MDREFKPFPKIARLERDIVITEKIDGTNAAVVVTDDLEVYAQSRKRVIEPGQDNFGFAAWVAEHADELRDGLGPGHHFGEWWGHGIQRGYGLDEKRFSLFNVGRWQDSRHIPTDMSNRGFQYAPECCHVVPVLLRRTFSSGAVHEALTQLNRHGSVAAPGFDNPEGIVVFHTRSQQLYKVTLGDDGAKGNA